MSIAFFPGEVHAVLGENGAGKSTLASILSGNLQSDSGEIMLEGRRVSLPDAFAARSHGIDIVHQHFMLVPAFSIQENLALANPGRKAFLDVRAQATTATQIAETLGWPMEANSKTGSLGVGEQQRIEIVKALASGARVVFFDEPTANLSPSEVREFFRVITELKALGRSIVLITHKLGEALSIADRITILRKGSVVTSVPAADTDVSSLATWMVGDVPPALTKTNEGTGTPIVHGKAVCVVENGVVRVDSVDFTIARGEILGFGGVDGNGQVELAEALAGVRSYDGKIVSPKKTAYIPQDRRRDGLALSMSIEENLLIEGHRKKDLNGSLFLSSRQIRNWAKRLVEVFKIQTPSVALPVATLSGGNQQKVVLARALEGKPEFIVAVNPTRGLDILAESYVHTLLLEAKSNGVAVALFSTALDELALLADRTVFMNRGRLVSGGGVGQMLGGVP